MTTVLLWGNSWWLADAPDPLPFAGIDEAAAILAQHFGESRPPLRLIYQPDSLDTASTLCPKAGRSTLGAALAAEFPALSNPDFAWSHEPILSLQDGFTTILHFEREAVLFTLVAELAKNGLYVASAWPLGTFLQALPDEPSESGAVTVVALQADRACAYRHAADGRPSILVWHGAETVNDLKAWLAGIFAKNPDEPVLLVTAADESADALAVAISSDERPGLRWLALPDALALAAVLPRHHPAQLLPAMPVFTAQRAAIAASILFLALAGWSGTAYARDCLAWRAEASASATRKQALQTEVAHLRTNAGEISALRERLAGMAASPPCAELLGKLSTTLPADIAINEVRIGTDRFALAGFVAPTAAAGTWDTWRTRFAAPGSPWTAEGKPEPGGAFTLNGTFRG